MLLSNRLSYILGYIRRCWLLLILIAFIFFIPGAAPFKADSFYGIANPYMFTLARWEMENILNRWNRNLSPTQAENYAGKPDYIDIVKNYFEISGKRQQLQDTLERTFTDNGTGGNPEKYAVETELAALNRESARLKGTVEAIIEAQVTVELKKENINFYLFSPGVNFFFPPVDIELSALPSVLVISPRQRIELKDSVLLKAPLPAETMAALENRLEKLDYSALVDSIGGVATYPAMVADPASLDFTVSAAAHEWVHHYLFFRPLGRHYSDNQALRTINETSADIIGNEIADKILELYGIHRTEQRARKPRDGEGFNFNREMRQIRVTVDEYLREGKVEEAEQYMEEQRRFLLDNGYYIRKL
ncbi:MAG: hypothetical protein U1D67_08160, partial [Dehalococcoidia bacterium]|nr:hypothetical protein [Dehalococcoidia bacterium]